MKSTLLILLSTLLISSITFAEDCKTFEGHTYTCGEATSMLNVILQNSEVSLNTVYSYRGSQKTFRHIVRYADTKTNGSDAYFQDYIYSFSAGIYHLVHFIKMNETTYDVYLDVNLLPTGDFKKDTHFISSKVEYLGTSTNVTFDQDGYPQATVETAMDQRELSSNKNGLKFSIVGGPTELYSLIYKLK